MRRVSITILVAGLCLAAASSPVGAATPAPQVSEAAVLELQDLASSMGALGVYRDGAAYVVVRPASRPDLASATLSVPGLEVRIKAVDIELKTLDRVSADLEGLRPTVKGSYGFGFDPESATFVVQSEAPKSAFASVISTYPGLIDFHSGKWDLTSWDNDGQPHWGGAWVQGDPGGCTSAFTIADNNHHAYMVTAGHCFPQGTVTNMGTAWRPSDTYPFYDFEFITGHSYAGYMYDSATTRRPVKNASNPGVGYVYCTTGRTSGFNCDWTVRRLNQTMCYGKNGECYHSLAAFNRPSGIPVQPGDSGGPLWVKYSDGTAGVRGVTSGRFWDVGTFSWLSYATQYQQPADLNVMHAVIP